MRRALAACFLAGACAEAAPAPDVRLQYVLTAEQYGVVGYRDPAGVIAPDGERIAWAVQQHVYVRRAAGGPVRELDGGSELVRHLAWQPDSRHLVVQRTLGGIRWWRYDAGSGQGRPLWAPGDSLRQLDATGRARAIRRDRLDQLAWSPDGARIAGVAPLDSGTALWVFRPEGDSTRLVTSRARLASPAFDPRGGVACLADLGAGPRLSYPCGALPSGDSTPAFGPLAFAPDGATLYYAAPNPTGSLDLYQRPAAGGPARRLVGFSRDAYAPSVTADGAVLFKVQTYRSVVSSVPASGGPVTPLTTFQSETPSWDPTGRRIGLTYGTWRRVVDDYRYPDIAQDAGIIAFDTAAPATTPLHVVDDSPSEDQSLCWSPNGRWIVYHSHKNLGDDLWLLPADRSAPARRITRFGRGFETGWPRWSPDGRWVAFDADAPDGSRRSLVYVIGVDQESGAVTAPAAPIRTDGFSGGSDHAEWLGSEQLVVSGFDAPDRYTIYSVSRRGGPVHVVRRYASAHRFASLSVSPDGRWVVFPMRAADGYWQLFRAAMAGRDPIEQLTRDPSNKTQPAYAPDGQHLALTVWEYQVQFWLARQPSATASSPP